MERKKVLFISGSVGLGHVTRDLAIADELRKLHSGIEISWLAAHPATQAIINSGESLLSDSNNYASDTISAEKSAKGNQLNLIKFSTKTRQGWMRNYTLFKEIINREQFDLIIGDETFYVLIGLRNEPDTKKPPFCLILDFVGIDAMTKNPLEKLKAYFMNRMWSIDFKKGREPDIDLSLFVGEPDDVPDKKFGFMLPNRLEWANASCKFVGYIVPFDPAEYHDKAKTREQLGYGKEPLIICAIGGTSIGKELLELCGQAYHLVASDIPELQMVFVCGPRLSPDLLNVPDGIELKDYVPDLYQHFAAADLSIVQGGGTSTLELTALNKTFIYFPIEGHFEQALVSERLTRHNAGIKMTYSQTSPKILADTILSNLGKDITYPPIKVDGAQMAAMHILELL